MPKIDSEVVETAPFFPGLVGEITAAEEVKTAVQGYTGIRVSIVGDDGEEYAEMLWKRPVVGTRSKLGIFMNLFGSDTDLWLHKRVRILKWQEKDRDIEEAPAKKTRKEKTQNETIKPEEDAEINP